MVSERGVRTGQYVHAGTQVIAVVPLETVWVIANYKETQLTHVANGQRAEIRIDTFPGIAINATVDSIAPASGSQFSLLPPDNATGNFTKVVQRIPVKLRIAPDHPACRAPAAGDVGRGDDPHRHEPAGAAALLNFESNRLLGPNIAGSLSSGGRTIPRTQTKQRPSDRHRLGPQKMTQDTKRAVSMSEC